MKLIQLILIVTLSIQIINCSSLSNKNENQLQPTTKFEDDTKVLLNYFETHKTTTNWKDEITEMGSIFLMLYEEWSEPCALAIPKFDRASQINQIQNLTYAAVNCKNARSFCIMLNAKKFPTIYFIKDYEHFYQYDSHQQYQFYVTFITHSHKSVPHTNLDILLDHNRRQKQQADAIVKSFQREVLHINSDNFTYLKHPNQFIIFYTPTNSYTQQILPIVQELQKERLLIKGNKLNYAAVNVADDNTSMSVAFQIQRYPFIICTFDEDKYAVYNKPIDKKDLFDFGQGGYRDVYNNAGPEFRGNILEKVQKLQELDEVGKKAREYKRKTQNAKDYRQRQQIIKEMQQEEVKETELQQQLREAKAAAREQSKKRNEELSKKRKEEEQKQQQQKREEL